jgi:predicted ribosomally synthesized peptide with SipW-like signal peptide
MSDDNTEDFELTRKQILTGLGTIGAAGAAAGTGTVALFSDEETLGNNSLTAGTLNLEVAASVADASDHFTSDGSAQNIIGSIGTADGGVQTGLQVADLKPGDWAILAFEFTIEDNPGFLRISAENFAQYENGQPDPEVMVDDSSGGSVGLPFDGRGEGELQDALQVALYDQYTPSNSSNPPRSYLNGQPEGVSGTAREVFDRFADGVVVGGRAAPTEVGPNNSPVTRYLLLELPEDVGNEVQTDSVAFDLVFRVEQSRHNEIEGRVTRTIGATELSRGESTVVTLSVDLPRTTSLDVLERFVTSLGTGSFQSATLDGESVAPTFVEFDAGGGVILFDEIGPGSVSVRYTLQVDSGADPRTYQFSPNEIDIDGDPGPVTGTSSVEVTR